MSARLISRYADDPRVVTIVVTTLVACVLWLATWQTMGGMSGMGDMDAMGEMSSGSMAKGEMSSGAMQSGSMASGEMASGSMGADSEGQAGTKDPATPMPGMSDSGMDHSAMSMPGMSMDPTDWSAHTIAVTTAMWILMMAAMMLPSMAPVMAIYAGISAKEDSGARLALRIVVFAAGYFLLWAIFSVFAALGQLGLRGSEWFTMGGTLAEPYAAGILMIIAGVYQFTAVKEFCLRHCRHPLTYLMSHWREGLAGAFPVGARHGVYCLGCCIALMGLMFVFGAMNVVWMAVIALYFLAEKVLPGVETWGRITGALLIGAGGATLAYTAI